MALPGCVDVAEETRIRSLLADPRNHAWPALDCEALDGFVPDLGLTGYANPSVYRPPSVVRAGIRSTVRHRFRVPVKNPTLPGTYYLALLAYDAAGEELAFEISLGAEPVGVVAAHRHDNRRHLLVLERAIRFDSTVKWVQAAASCSGACRLERLVLLTECPRPSSFAPVIERLQVMPAAASASGGADASATVHCVTYPPATLELTAHSPGAPPVRVAEKRRSTLHALLLPDLLPGRTYTVNVLAAEQEAATATTAATLSTAPAPAPPNRPVQAELELTGPAATALAGLPLRFGVPVPRGALHTAPSAAIQVPGARGGPRSGDSHGAQTRIHSRWPDGSARWVLVDTTAPRATGQPADQVNLRLHLAGNTADEAKPGPLVCHREQRTVTVSDGQLRVTLSGGAAGSVSSGTGATIHSGAEALLPGATSSGDSPDTGDGPDFGAEAGHRGSIGHDAGSVASRRVRSGAEASGGAAGRESWLRIERRTAAGGWEAALDSGTLAEAFEVRLADGTRLHSAAAAPPRVQEAGGWHTVLRLAVLHRDPAGHVRLRSELRLHVYREQPFIKLDHRLLVVCANPAAAQYVAGETDERETLLPVRCCVLHLPWEHARQVSRGGERHAVAAGRPWRLRHEHDLEHHAGSPGAELRSGRAAGHVVIHGATELLALGVRHFWQTCPKGIRVEADSITVEVLPPLSGAELPGDADAWHRLYRWLDGKRYLLREGLALTTEILVAFPAAAAAAEPLFQWLETPPAVRPRLDYANGTGALPRLAAKQGSALPDYETLAGAALHRLQEDREASRAYGHLNFGDWYGEGDWCWGNNEYDTPYGAYWEFLRGGDPAWATWGAEAARHLADVDTVNCFSDPGCVGLQPMHMPAHLGGYLPPLFRSKVDGTRGIPSHTWMEGALLHYLLTGDEGVRESLSRTGDWLLRPERLDHYEFSAVREAGWHLIHLSTLAAATGDPRALDGAAIVVRRILEKQDAGGAWTRMLTSGHCWCGYPHCSGNIAFMVTVLLSGMKRYYDLTGDPAVAAAIIAGARWLLRETLDPETGHFIGGSCSTMQRLSRGDASNTQIVIEGIADAYALSGDAELGRCLQRALPALSRFPDLEGHRDLGKRLSQQMRYVPTVLAALESRPPEPPS